MLLEKGAKVLICHRRLFAEDHPRFFVGTVDQYADGIAKVSGFSWTRDAARGFQRKADERTKLIALASGAMIVYEVPASLHVESLRIEQPGGHSVIVTDGARFRMDLSERV
jgi:hypothetical protein